MPRLPQPGGDKGNWGAILNDYLSQAHKPDGTLKDSAVSVTAIANNAVTEGKLDGAVRAKLNSGGGTPGATGPQGPAGTNGSVGATGSRGATGAQGSIGPAGPSGTPGAQGATGPKGDQGNTGLQGATGPAGSQGVPGSQGSSGATGPHGATGPQGPAGTGATGPSGTPGQTGATGAAGTPGLAGATGPKGDQGDPGAAGAQGATGPQGPQGPAGPAGSGTSTGAAPLTSLRSRWRFSHPSVNYTFPSRIRPPGYRRRLVIRNDGNQTLQIAYGTSTDINNFVDPGGSAFTVSLAAGQEWVEAGGERAVFLRGATNGGPVAATIDVELGVN